MQDYRPGVRPRPHRHQNSLELQLPAQLGLHRPANHLTGEQIEDDGQIESTFRCADIRDIRHPFRIGSLGAKVSGQMICRMLGPVARLSTLPPFPGRNPLEPFLLHESGHPMLAARLSPRPQLLPHLRAAIHPVMLRMDRMNLLHELRILQRSWAWLTPLARIVATRRDTQQATHHPNG